jgi:hypothetical protein
MTEQTITAGNISVEIFCDLFAESPREWGNETKFIMFHRRYNLPNEAGIDHNDYASWSEMEEALQLQYKWVYPVYMYEHSGTGISLRPFNDSWDSGQIGFVVCDEKDEESARKFAEQEVATYDEYMNGHVYGFSVFEDTDMLDSCGGFYGYDQKENGLKDELGSYLSRVTTEDIKEQILNQIS